MVPTFNISLLVFSPTRLFYFWSSSLFPFAELDYKNRGNPSIDQATGKGSTSQKTPLPLKNSITPLKNIYIRLQSIFSGGIYIYIYVIEIKGEWVWGLVWCGCVGVCKGGELYFGSEK